MKTLIKKLILCALVAGFAFLAMAEKVHVNGYYRKDGTYVKPYDRNASGQGSSTSSTYTPPAYNYSSEPRSQTYTAPAATSYSAPKKTYSYYPIGSAYGQSYSSYTLSSYKGARDSHGRIVRSESAKRAFMKQTGYPHGRPGYVVDHIIPLKRGGADAPSNMQWQTIAEGKAKDKWE